MSFNPQSGKDIASIPIQELKQMSSEQVLEKFRMVIYSDEDITQINKGLDLIREVLEKNAKKLENKNGVKNV